MPIPQTIIMPAPAKAGPADPACSARPPRRTSPTKSPPTAPVSWPSVPRDGTFRREQQTRSQAETDPGHHPQRPFPIDSSQPPAASSLGGFPTRAEVTPRRSRPPRPASKNRHHTGLCLCDPVLHRSFAKAVIEESGYATYPNALTACLCQLRYL